MHERVLLVEDEESIAQALSIRLRTAGYQVKCAADGPAGIAAAESWRPEVIVLDIRMPQMDGFEVSRHLKAIPELAGIPLVFLSANVQESVRQGALAAGAFAFLSKPYEAKVVLETIRSAAMLSIRTGSDEGDST